MVCLILHTVIIISRKNWRITIKLHSENLRIFSLKSERTHMLGLPFSCLFLLTFQWLPPSSPPQWTYFWMTANGPYYILTFTRYITTKLGWILACEINPIITQGMPFSSFIFNACKKWIAGEKKIDEWEKLFMASNRWFTFEI